MSEADKRLGWNEPKPDVVPTPTAWPAAMALGIALVGWGLVTSLVILAIGLLMSGVSLAGWIGDIRDEGPERPEA